MPESCEEKVFPFPAKEIRKQEVTANVLLSQMDAMDPEDLIIVKFVLKYYILKMTTQKMVIVYKNRRCDKR